MLRAALGRIASDAVNIDPDEEWPAVVYSWAAECWSCAAESWVWFENHLLDVGIPTRRDMRGDMSRAISGRVPLALLGQVTTAAGGTYLGFRCHQCEAVLGKHFLRRDLFEMLADRAPQLVTSYFTDDDLG